ncbi:MAG: hypothetical protein EOP04_13720 [Proteobacteria bacterium]|nr:MAG: hypothetical protein EOP04_13720 [Pseudomonadota bacterium]
MSLFSRLFGTKGKPTFQSNELGTFTLVYSKGGRNVWSGQLGELHLSCLGTEDQPYVEHLNTLRQVSSGISQMSPVITRQFHELFEEADLPADFSAWQDRFVLVGLEIQDPSNWIISFQDTKENLAHYNLQFEDGLPADFSIDT